MRTVCPLKPALSFTLAFGLATTGTAMILGSAPALASNQSAAETIANPDPQSAISEWTYQGRWVRSTQYTTGDVVVDRGQSYIALQDNHRSRPRGNNSNEDWGLLAKRGADGEAGPTGPQGERGVDGPEGPQGQRGPRGHQGEEGPQGPQGPRGLTGLAGQDGTPHFVSFYRNSLGLTTSYASVASVSITVPSDGTVLLNATGNYDFVGVPLEPSVLSIASCRLLRDGENPSGSGRQNTGVSNDTTLDHSATLALQRPVSVEAGTHEFHLTCRKSREDRFVTVFYVDLTAMFFPEPRS